MKKWFKNNLLLIMGVFTGAVAGFLYWKFVGCASGTCAITSKPVNSTLYGAVMGGLLFSIFKPNKKIADNDI
jgi:H+/Cl- antiporter ClcA